MDVWTSLTRALREQPTESLRSPREGRRAAVLVMLSDDSRGDPEIVYTRRRDDLATHPGQISFPGGRVELGETPESAAVREAVEEVALDPSSVDVRGRMPAFYIPPSRYWVQPVVARWRAPHELAPSEAEVAEVLRVRLSTLRDPAVWRAVRLSPATTTTWAWQLDERNVLWGATGIVTAALLDMIDPGWHGGVDPATLPPHREARPWETPVPAPLRGPPRLPGLAERPVTAAATVSNGGTAARGGTVNDGRAADAGRAVAAAVDALDPTAAGGTACATLRRVVVLAGGGGNGAAGLHAARRLRDTGRNVRIVLDRPPADLRPVAARALPAVADVAQVFDGELPGADVVVDALVGRGLAAPLAGVTRQIVLALHGCPAPVLAVDLPTGLDPVDGLVGDCVSADVTVALGAPGMGLLAPPLGPFVGDLYLAALRGVDEDLLVRLVADAPRPRGRP